MSVWRLQTPGLRRQAHSLWCPCEPKFRVWGTVQSCRSHMWAAILFNLWFSLFSFIFYQDHPLSNNILTRHWDCQWSLHSLQLEIHWGHGGPTEGHFWGDPMAAALCLSKRFVSQPLERRDYAEKVEPGWRNYVWGDRCHRRPTDTNEELHKTFLSMASVLLPGRADGDCTRPAGRFSSSFFLPSFFKYKLNTKPNFDVEWTFHLFNDLKVCSILQFAAC